MRWERVITVGSNSQVWLLIVLQILINISAKTPLPLAVCHFKDCFSTLDWLAWVVLGYVKYKDIY